MIVETEKLLVCTPAYGHAVDIGFFIAFEELAKAGKVKEHALLCGNADVRHARNMLANFFYRQKRFNTLVFVDADMGFDIAAWDALTGDYEEPATCGVYAKKEIGAEPSFGLGFCRIHRSVFDSLIAKNDLVKTYRDSNGEQHFDFFGRTRLDVWNSESIEFWRNVQDCGINVRELYAPSVVHYGRHGYVLKTVSSLA